MVMMSVIIKASIEGDREGPYVPVSGIAGKKNVCYDLISAGAYPLLHELWRQDIYCPPSMKHTPFSAHGQSNGKIEYNLKEGMNKRRIVRKVGVSRRIVMMFFFFLWHH